MERITLSIVGLLMLTINPLTIQCAPIPDQDFDFITNTNEFYEDADVRPFVYYGEAFYMNYTEPDLHHITGLPVLDCPTMEPISNVKYGGTCPRGWSNKNSVTAECSAPDVSSISPCLLFNNKISNATFSEGARVSCLNLHLECLGNVVFPGNTKALALRNNQLSDANEFKEILSYLRDLTVIDVGYNSFTKISNSLFEHNPNLLSVNFDYNKIRYVPSYTFYDNQNLRSVSFTGNKMTLLNGNIFFENPLLIEVDFSTNNLTFVPVGIFMNNPKLKIVNFSSNMISEISSSMFMNSLALETLDLSNNRIEYISNAFLLNLRFLKNFNIASNQIQALPRAWLTLSTGIRTLDISNNPIHNIPPVFFANNPSLNLIGLWKNALPYRSLFNPWNTGRHFLVSKTTSNTVGRRGTNSSNQAEIKLEQHQADVKKSNDGPLYW